MDETSCTIDDIGPMPVVRPATPAEAGEQVRAAAASGRPLFPLGGRTQLDLGLPPERPGLALDLTGLDRVIDYPARDMTITVQAGIRVAALQRLLAGEGQRLPIDVPRPEQATLGGAIATNTSGPRRLGAGTLRDYVIGITTINDEGQETRAGGRVVKNVAGYDLCKLHTGALGTLGLVSQVTLKVRPCPESQALVTFGSTPAELANLLDQLHASRARPVCSDVVNAAAARRLREQTGLALPDLPWVVIVGFEESEQTVGWQIQQLLRELTAAGIRGVEALAGVATEPLWQALTELTVCPDAQLTLRASVLPAHVARLATLASELAGTPLVQAHAGSGIVRVQWLANLSLADATTMLDRLSTAAADAGGHLVVPRCPAAWKRHLPIWGRPRGDAALMARVKHALDPRRLFNPGRFVGGL